MDRMAELKARVQGTLLENEPMSKHTSYGIGGPAWADITPKDKNVFIQPVKEDRVIISSY